MDRKDLPVGRVFVESIRRSTTVVVSTFYSDELLLGLKRTTVTSDLLSIKLVSEDDKRNAVRCIQVLGLE